MSGQQQQQSTDLLKQIQVLEKSINEWTTYIKQREYMHQQDGQQIQNEQTIYQKLDEAKKLGEDVLGRLNQNVTLNDSDAIQLFYKIQRALRLTNVRKQKLQNSINALTEEKAKLQDDYNDALGNLQEDRGWAREFESTCEAESNANMKKEREESKIIKDRLQEYEQLIEKAKTNARDSHSNQRELELFATHLALLIQQLEKNVNNLPKPTDPTILQYVDTLDATINNLEDRFRQYRIVLETSTQTDKLRLEVETLSKVLEESYNTYYNRYSSVSQLGSKINGFKNGIKLLTDQANSSSGGLEEKKKTVASLTERLNLLTQYEKTNNANITRLTKEKQQIKADNPNLFKKYDEYNDLLNTNNLLNEQINNEAHNFEILSQAEKKAREYLNRYKANQQNPGVIKEANENFSRLITENERNITTMIAKADQSIQSNRTNDFSEDLEQKLKACTRPPKPKEINLEAENEDFSNKKLLEYKHQNAEYKENGDKVIIEWGTLQTTLALVFHQENKEPHYIQLNLFSWHNTKEDNKEKVLEYLEGFYTTLISNKTGFENIQIDRSTFENRLIQYIQKWVEMFPQDFQGSNEKFKNELIQTLLQKKDMGIDTNDIIQQLNSPPSGTIPYKTPKFLAQINSSIKPNPKIFSFSRKYDPNIVAEHLMYADYKHFNKITYSEYLQCGWSAKVDPHSKSPNLCDLTDRFNKLSQYIQYTIVRESKVNESANVLASWINVMSQCRQLNYYHGLFAIDGALSAPPVLRLDKVWTKIGPQMNNLYQSLSRICSPLKKFKNYKAALSECTKNGRQNTFPYVGPWLTDMTFVKDGNPKSKTEGNNELLNFIMHRAYFVAASYLKQDWCTNHDWKINEAILKEAEELRIDPKEEIDENKLLQLSKKVK